MIINKDWSVESDGLQVVLLHKRSKKDADNKDRYETFYYASVAGALYSLVAKEVLGTGLKDLKTVSQKLEDTRKDIMRAVGSLRTVPATMHKPAGGKVRTKADTKDGGDND